MTAAAHVRQAFPPRAFLGWRMVALTFLVQNFAIGLTFGAYGVSVVAIEHEFGINRTLASLPLSLVIFMITLAAPILGSLYGRISIRRTMMVGILLGSFGYFLLSIVHDAWAMLAIYLLLIGPGVAFTGTLPCNVLVSNWFVSRQGRALGVINMPLLVMLVPLISVAILEKCDLRTLYFWLAIAQLVVLPAAWALIDRPDQIGQRALGAGDDEVASGTRSPIVSLVPAQMLLGRLDFWLIIIGLGVIVGIGTMKLSHMVPLLAELGRPMEQASLLLALSGGAGMFGSLIFGWLADRYGGAPVLALNAILQCVTWVVFLLPVGFALLALDAIVIGMCGGGIVAAQGVLFSHLYGSANFGRVLGFVSVGTLPFLVGASPLAGYLHDLTGHYTVPIVVQIAAGVIVALIFLYLAFAERSAARRARRSAA